MDRGHVLVTGAAGGMGLGTAQVLASRGYAVSIGDVSTDAGEGAAEAIRESGDRAWFHRLDVSDEDSVVEFMSKATAQFGPLVGAVNNAGINYPVDHVPLADVTLEQWTRVMDVNMTGVFLCMKHEIKHFREHGTKGSVVNISSICGLFGAPGRAAYVSTKHGVIGLTKAAAVDYGADGMRFNAICPGPIATQILREVIARNGAQRYIDQTPARRIGEVEEIAGAVAYLLSEDSTYVNGSVLSVDGGSAAGGAISRPVH